MIEKAKLVALLLSFAPVRDYERVRLPIPRSERTAITIATAALETDDPIWYAIRLDVFGAHESGYDPSLVGDHRTGVARSCGAWQTPCEKTAGFSRCDDGADCKWGWKFTSSPHVALDQARLACKILKEARDNCSVPEWRYASGLCVRTRTADLYLEDVRYEVDASKVIEQ